MAETLSPAKEEARSKTVHELIISGQELPEKYIYKGNDAATLGDSLPLMKIPVIDVGRLTSPSFNREQELEKLRSALCFWDCFQV